jgi:hypothetical protein
VINDKQVKLQIYDTVCKRKPWLLYSLVKRKKIYKSCIYFSSLKFRTETRKWDFFFFFLLFSFNEENARPNILGNVQEYYTIIVIKDYSSFYLFIMSKGICPRHLLNLLYIEEERKNVLMIFFLRTTSDIVNENQSKVLWNQINDSIE